MDKAEIDKKLQQEKDRHANEINRITKDKCKENERYQRNKEYWQNKKRQLTQKTHEQNLLKECLLAKLEQLIKKATETSS